MSDALKIEYVELSELHEAQGNARLHGSKQVAKIIRSIQRFGIVTPILIAPDNEVVAGHGRLAALRQIVSGTERPAGFRGDSVPCIRMSTLSADQRKAYRIADNRLAEESSWSMPLLSVAVQDLHAVGFDLSAIGFSDYEFGKLLAPALPDLELISCTVVTRCSRGELWELGEHRLIVGDAMEASTIGRLMGGDRATCLITDPPWNVSIGLGTRIRHRQREGLQNDSLTDDEFSVFLSRLFAACADYVEGDCYCVMASRSWGQCASALRDAGMHFGSMIIWVKDQFVLGRSNYHTRHEPIWYGWRKSGKSSFVADRKQDDVWEIPRPRVSKDHPTEKPVELYERAIRNSSRKGDVVLDVCCGSGPIFLAAERLGRRARGCEISPAFADVIIARWEAFSGKRARIISPEVGAG